MTEPEQILNKLLEQIAMEQKYVGYEIKIQPVVSGGANYTSTLYNVTITERGSNAHHMFAKIASAGDSMRSQNPMIYVTENIVYSKVLQAYEDLQNKYNVPQEHRLMYPKYYGCNSVINEETIVLEDLVKGGYQAFDRFKTFDWDYAKSAVTQLAKMHALSLAYSEYHKKEFDQLVENFHFDKESRNEKMVAYYEKSIAKALEKTRVENRDKLKKFFESFMVKIPEAYSWSRRPVFGHGDYRPSNLMHKHREDGTVDIKIVDLQTVQALSPVVDLVYFIFTGSDEQFRGKYYERLLDEYYSEIAAALKRLHLDPEKIYSREDMDFEMEEKLPYGLTIAVFALPFIVVETDDAPELNKELELSAFPMEKTSARYTERLNGIVNDFVRWGVLK